MIVVIYVMKKYNKLMYYIYVVVLKYVDNVLQKHIKNVHNVN